MGPRQSVREVDADLTAPGAPFEIEEVEVDGRPVRVWAVRRARSLTCSSAAAR